MDEEAAELVAAALKHNFRAGRTRTYKRFKLVACERCFRSYVSDYMVLGCVRDRSCELCGCFFHLGFELLFVEAACKKMGRLGRG